MRSQIVATADSSAIEIPLPAGNVRVSLRSPNSIDESFERRWLALEERAVEDNVFLSPHFVLPAWRHDPWPPAEQESGSGSSRTSPLLLTIEQDVESRTGTVQDDDANQQLIGLALFEESRGNRLMPLPMLKCWKSLV